MTRVKPSAIAMADVPAWFAIAILCGGVLVISLMFGGVAPFRLRDLALSFMLITYGFSQFPAAARHGIHRILLCVAGACWLGWCVLVLAS